MVCRYAGDGSRAGGVEAVPAGACGARMDDLKESGHPEAMELALEGIETLWV